MIQLRIILDYNNVKINSVEYSYHVHPVVLVDVSQLIYGLRLFDDWLELYLDI